MTLPDTRRYRPADDVLFQEVSGEIAILDLGSEEYFGLNEIGGRIWQLIDQGHSVGEVLECLSVEFDADEAIIAADLERLLTELVQRNLLVDVSQADGASAQS